MLKKGENFSELLLEGLSEEQIRAGLDFFRAASSFTSTLLPLMKLNLGDPGPRQ
jgi:hypothetical protein